MSQEDTLSHEPHPHPRVSLAALAFNLGHDGAVASLLDGRLEFSLEGEKDSHRRNATLRPAVLFDAIRRIDRVPDVVAIEGWDRASRETPDGNPDYEGVDTACAVFTPCHLFGTRTTLLRSTHERAHIFCSYGLSPLDQGEPCYALIWEGQIGAFYEISKTLTLSKLGQVMRAPGYKYSFLFDLADPTRAQGGWRHDAAGKLMALAAYSSGRPSSSEEQSIIDRILASVGPPDTSKDAFAESRYRNCGVTAQHFTELAGKFSDTMFRAFSEYARLHLKKRLPLLIAGGCGLNCGWNTRWRECGIFSDVFVPPVPNDSGLAIGAAVEAQYLMTGQAKIQWDVYSGLDFVWDHEPSGFTAHELDFADVARVLASNEIVAWVQGKYEIGPRALGNRSLLASPFDTSMTDRLNRVKCRESYRPIAPVCLASEAGKHFGIAVPSPHMLYAVKVLSPELRAVTHVDGSSRLQTVSDTQNPPLHSLLCAFRQQTGVGVLCNTSLNRPGRGFINRSSDLFTYAVEQGIRTIVIGSRVFRALA